jgi:hypothetical protein
MQMRLGCRSGFAPSRLRRDRRVGRGVTAWALSSTEPMWKDCEWDGWCEISQTSDTATLAGGTKTSEPAWQSVGGQYESCGVD